MDPKGRGLFGEMLGSVAEIRKIYINVDYQKYDSYLEA